MADQASVLTWRQRFKDLRVEWRARRDGQKQMRGTSNIGRATRDITGPTGWVFSNAWDKLDQSGEAYMDSFDRRVPASLFVSDRDRTRFDQPMPVRERCIETWDEQHQTPGTAD